MTKKKQSPRKKKADPFRSDVRDRLRKAIAESGLSLYALEGKTGVDSGRLSRFMRGERDLTLAAAEKIFDALGLVMSRPPQERQDAPGTLADSDTQR